MDKCGKDKKQNCSADENLFNLGKFRHGAKHDTDVLIRTRGVFVKGCIWKYQSIQRFLSVHCESYSQADFRSTINTLTRCLFFRNGKNQCRNRLGWVRSLPSERRRKKQHLLVGNWTERLQRFSHWGVPVRDLSWEWLQRHSSHPASAQDQGPGPGPGWDWGSRGGAGSHNLGEQLCVVGAPEEEEAQRADAPVHGQPVRGRPGGGALSGQFLWEKWKNSI